MTTYKDLLVWQLSMDLIVQIYLLAGTLPESERFGLCSQLQRAAVSIPSNVAEGHSHRTPGAFLHHVSIALGSQGEVVSSERCARDTGKMLYGLYGCLERSSRRKRGLLYSLILIVPGAWYLAWASGLRLLTSGL